LSTVKAIVLFSFVALTLSFCKKEVGERKRPFKATFETWYRVSPAAPQPLSINNQNYLGILYFPGSGTGTVSHLGRSTNVFNQLAYIQPPGEAILGSVAAPVASIPTYPVAGEFSAFIPFNTSLAIPDNVGRNIVNSVFYNQKGDAIFTSAITGSSRTEFVSSNRINFYGKGLIVGGRGRFEAATGEFDFNGHFNPENNNDASFNAEGWIDY
jgi:hypothetical protein